MNRKPLTVYKASAGSGKTFTLATEYIRLIVENPQSYRNILAVTFTNKATEEMKMRILSQLYGIWKQLPESDNYLRRIAEQTGYEPKVICERAGIGLTNLLNNYNYFRVETIDTFFQSVLRNMARELDLTNNLRIGLNDNQVEEMAVDQLIADLSTTDMVLQWILKYIMDNISDDKSWNIISQIKRFGRTIFKDEYKRVSRQLEQKMNEKGFFEQYTTQLREIRQAAQERMKEIGESFFDTLEGEGLTIDDLANKGRGIASFFNKLRNGIFDASIENATVANHLGSPEKWCSRAHPQRDFICALAESTLGDILRYAVEERPQQWKLYKSADLTLCHLNQLRLLGSIEEKVHQLNETANRFLLSDTQQLLHSLIDGSDSPFIFEKIGTQLEHVMIDEFQDTSTVQWQNFRVLLDEAMSHEGGSNLIVGDVKQSIYRFRGGDWEILQKLGQKYDPDGRNTLHNNFRSEGNVVKFNNDLFAAIRDAYSGDYGDLYADVKQNIIKGRENRGYVDIRVYEKEGTAEEQRARQCEGLLESIRTAHDAGVRYADMAILCRSKADITTITDYLAVNTPEISITTEEAYNLTGSLAVQMIIAAIRYINGDATSNPDIISGYFLALEYSRMLSPDFTAPVFAAGDREAKAVKSFIHSHLPDELTRDGAFLVRLPIDELVMRLIRILRLGNLSSESQYIFTFVDYVNSYAALNGYDLQRFLDDWESEGPGQRISSGQEDSISAMTIHKAKGLEFHTVFIPFCDWKFVANNKANTMWCEPNGDASDKTPAVYSDIPLVPINFHKAAMNSIYAGDYQRESHNIMVDNLNYLYVALTRARCNLFVGYTHKAEAGPRSNPDAITSITAGRLMDRALSGSDFNPDEYKGEIIPSAPADNKEAEDTFSTEGELLNFPTSISDHA